MSTKMNSKITFEIGIDELTRRTKEQTGLSDKKVEQIVENVLCLADVDIFISDMIEHFSEEVADDSSEEEDEEEEEDKHECELCKKHVQETEYLPSKEDEEKQQILGNDYCLECYKKVEKFEFVENIDLDK
jgi:nitrate/TMAO reductase-like tetraheme cytochrome c subunit